ncbi:MAG: PLP-dependent transferase [Gammaproteobacteria bacterium]|jgi:cystathionine beta-lyase/cystathionine gamma-synthase
MKKSTRVNHQPEVRLPEGNESVTSPIYQSVKFTYDRLEASMSPEAREFGFNYTRDANPTTRQLELLAAEIQGRDDAVAVATGMAAIWLTLLGNLTTGDRVVFFLESYRPSRIAIRKFLPRLGIGHSMLSVHDEVAIERELARKDTKLMLFESPTNPMLQIVDIKKIIDIAHRHDVVTALDNTFAGLHNHGDFDIDYFVHSLTKYANGHGDTMGGIVIGSKEKLRAIKPLAVNMGPTLDPGAAFLILRGMKTYFLRYRQHTQNATAIAEYLEAHPQVSRVWYPGLESDPGFALAQTQMNDTGGVVSFELNADKAGTHAFIDALTLFATTASLGSTESLVSPVRLFLGSDLSADELERSMITDSTVRLAVGVEHIDDLIADLEQAFAVVR